MDKEKIKVMVVDDSALMRSLISRIVDSQDDMTVIGKAMNGSFALQKIPMLNPDIIVLDLEMPEMNGIDFLKEKEKQKISIPVIVLSSIAQKGASITFEALSLGASDFITKPSGEGQQNLSNVAAQLCTIIRAYTGRNLRRADTQTQRENRQPRQDQAAQVKPPQVLTPHSRLLQGQAAQGQAAQAKPLQVQIPAAGGRIELIAIGISTGGPNALRIMLSEFKSDFNVPIVIVQHMPVGFTAEFAKSLARNSHFDVKEAEDGDLILPGRVLVSPGSRHMSVEKKRLGGVVRLSDEDSVNGHKPSAGVLFSSVAYHYKNNAMGIIMTGMGRDGSAEIGKIYQAGGLTVAQDEASSVVFGMPRVAIEKGFIHKIVSLQDMAEFITDYVSAAALAAEGQG